MTLDQKPKNEWELVDVIGRKIALSLEKVEILKESCASKCEELVDSLIKTKGLVNELKSALIEMKRR
jgi:hypothetical protein